MLWCRKILVVAAWTIFSFSSHYAAKRFVNHFPLVSGSTAILALLLTFGQISTCMTFLDQKVKVPWKLVWMAVTSHFAAMFATNYSFGRINASSTLTIKLGEPIVSAVILWLTSGHRFTLLTAVALLIVVHGSTTFAGHSLLLDPFDTGIHLAFLSNVLLATRNVIIKEALPANWLTLNTDKKDFIIHGAGAVLVLLFSVSSGEKDEMVDQVTAIASYLSSCVSHLIYTYVSLQIVLQYLGVVGHSVANIFKRLSVILVMIVVDKRITSPTMWAGLVEATIGLVIYAIHKQRTRVKQTDEKPKEVNIQRVSKVMWSSMLMMLAVALSEQVNYLTSQSQLKIHKDITLQTNREKKDLLEHFRDLAGTSKHVAIIGFMSEKSSRLDSFEWVGLSHILDDLNLKYEHCEDIKSCTSTLEVSNNTLVVIKDDKEIDLIAEHHTIVMLPSMANPVIGIKHRSKRQRLNVVTHDKFTYQMYAKMHPNAKVLLIPHLGFYIKTSKRFMSPTTDVVALQMKSSEKFCDKLGGQIRCDSRDWESQSDWYTPNYNGEAVDHVNRVWFGFMCVLRGKVLYTDRLGGLISAVLHDIPCFVSIKGEKSLSQYINTWKDNPHLEQNVFITDRVDVAAKSVVNYTNTNSDLPSLWAVF